MKINFLLVCLVSFILSSSGNNAFAQTADNEPFIQIQGEVLQQLTLSASELRQMNRVEVQRTDRDQKLHRYSGVPVADLLSKAGVGMGVQLRGENLVKYLLVRAADGYEVLFSLAELDQEFTDQHIILADEMDGQPLPAGMGPFRIIVPDDKRPARSIFEVTTLVVGFANVK